MPRRTHRRCLATVATIVVALSSVTTARADDPIVPLSTPTDGLVHVDGDFVVFDRGRSHPVEAKDGDGNGSGSVTTHDGYATFGDPDLLDHYDVRMVDSDRVEDLRPLVARAVGDTVGAAGQSLRVLAGTIRNQGTGKGQIDVVLSTSSPCGGAWLACAGPTLDDGVVVAGRIWVHPKLLDRPSHEIDNTLRHELGHTLGLAHYAGAVEGRVQTMHPTRFDAARWETGDRRGLRDLAGSPPAPVVILESVRVDGGVLEVAGRIDDARVGTVLLLTVDGVTERRTMQHSNFTRTQTVGGGRHEVCAAVERDGLPDGTVCETVFSASDPAGEIEAIGSGPHGIEIVGWARDPQTVAPITVVVTVGDRTVEVLAQSAHDPATHAAHGSTHGFEVVVPAASGEHSVCVTARNVGDGNDTMLGCRVIAVSELSVGRIGLQTI